MGSVVPVFVNVARPIHREENPFRSFLNERNPNQPRSPSFLSNLGVSVPRDPLSGIAHNIFNLVPGDSSLLFPSLNGGRHFLQKSPASSMEGKGGRIDCRTRKTEFRKKAFQDGDGKTHPVTRIKVGFRKHTYSEARKTTRLFMSDAVRSALSRRSRRICSPTVYRC